VTTTPEDNNITVFNRGKAIASKTWMSLGGQVIPINTPGERLKWKNAQKNAKKNIISEVINSNIPDNTFCWTLKVWWPS
jgi:hypothetical protein